MPGSLGALSRIFKTNALFCLFKERDELRFSDTFGTSELVVSSTCDGFDEEVRTEFDMHIAIAVLPRFNSAVDFQAQDELAEPR